MQSIEAFEIPFYAHQAKIYLPKIKYSPALFNRFYESNQNVIKRAEKLNFKVGKVGAGVVDTAQDGPMGFIYGIA